MSLHIPSHHCFNASPHRPDRRQTDKSTKTSEDEAICAGSGHRRPPVHQQTARQLLSHPHYRLWDSQIGIRCGCDGPYSCFSQRDDDDIGPADHIAAVWEERCGGRGQAVDDRSCGAIVWEDRTGGGLRRPWVAGGASTWVLGRMCGGAVDGSRDVPSPKGV